MSRSQLADLRDDMRSSMAVFGKAARSSGIPVFEAYVSKSRTKRVTVQPDGGRGVSGMDENALFTRVILDHRMGVSFTNDLRPARIAECLKTAARLSARSEKDDSLEGFPPKPEKYSKVKGLYSRGLAEIGFDEENLMMDAMLDSALDSRKDISVTGGEISASHYAIGIFNSNGIDVEEEFTRLEATCSTVCGKGRSVSPECLSSSVSRNKEMSFEEIGRESSTIAEYSCKRVRPTTEECQVAFSPRSLGSEGSGLLTIMMSRALSGMEAANESTVFVDKLGERVASECLSVRDGPTITGKAGSRPFDDEGVPTRNRWLVKKGILKSFAWDNYHAARAGLESTGNAVRNTQTGLVSPAPLLLAVTAGRGCLLDLISDIENGYLVWDCQGSHTSSPETGAFSFVASPGLKVEGGEVVGGIQGVMISGNILDLLRSVERVGDDVTDFGCSLMPSILFGGVKVTTD